MSASFIDETIQVGDPLAHRGVAIYPLFPQRSPSAPYITLEEALPLGFRVTEVSAAGSVAELLVRNPLDVSVLLYDGEELIGAKQNRILSGTVLVPATSELPIPVSCVEQGRWSGRSEVFSVARHTAHPELRRRKAEALAAAPLALGPAQREVWAAIADTFTRHGAFSPTMAQADLFSRREPDLAAMRGAFPLQRGQCGAILALPGGRADQVRSASLSLDYISRPDAFAQLYPRLLDGYLLDALERLDGTPVESASFLNAIDAARHKHGPSVGLGEDVRLCGDTVIGSGLALDGELLQLSAFTSEGSRLRSTRITRPSRRHE